MTTGAHVAFLVPAIRLSGGINVVMEHAANLTTTHGFRVSAIITHHENDEIWPFPALDRVEVLNLSDVGDRHFDLAIATFWDTVPALWSVDATHHAYFAQSLEDRFYPPAASEAALARLTYHVGLPVITEARWIYDTLAVLTPASQRFYARNGVAKETFGPIPEAPPQLDGPLRILLEGTEAWYKGLDDSLAAIDRMTCDKIVTVTTSTGLDRSRLKGVDVVHDPMPQEQLRKVYSEQHLLLKHSRVEGMYGPPIEAFHSGATIVTTPVTGHDEYVEHGWNGMIVDWDDPAGAARTLDLLATDRRLLEYLRSNALSTARLWPSWAQATEFFAAAINAILKSDPSPTFAGTKSLHHEARAEITLSATRLHEHKVKVLLTEQHVQKLDTAIAETRTRLDEELARREAAEARLAQVHADLESLGRSRWLRLLSVLEKPMRLNHPGLGSVRGRLQAIARNAGR